MVGLAAAWPCAGLAQVEAEQPAGAFVEQHVWAQFGIGSWKLVRVFTENLNADGNVESVNITETKTTLDKADKNGYTLTVEVIVEVAGKRFKAEPKSMTYGYHGESPGQLVEVKSLAEGETEISGEKYPTKVHQIVISNETTKSISNVHYSLDYAPHFLKRVTEALDAKTLERTYHSAVEVLALEMPEKVLTEIKSAAHVRTIENYASGVTKVTLEVYCESVPGGVVSHTSKQLDPLGHITQRSTLDLIDYHVVNRGAADGKLIPMPMRRRILPNRRRN